MIRGAADGNARDRERFVSRYLPSVEAYLRARWRGTPLLDELDDAVQEVFLDCFREEGALERVEPDRPSGFRAFLYGVARFVALRHEERRARKGVQALPSGLAVDEERLSVAFDRAWALTIVREAAERHASRARRGDDAARRRVELLRLRFEDGLPIRDIARLWGEDPARLHHEYARARREFKEALLDTVAFHHPAPAAEVESEGARLLDHFR
jgi:RNA polymerase sigma-70 factor (ECF subfamily)